MGRAQSYSFLLLVTGCALVFSGAISVAYAQDVSPVKTYTEKQEHYKFKPTDGTKKSTVDVYSRLGTTIKITLPPSEESKAEASATVECSAGQWTVVNGSLSGNCYDAFDYTYPEVHASDLNNMLADLRKEGYDPKYKKIGTRLGQDIYEISYYVPAMPVGATHVSATAESKCVGGRITSLKSPQDENGNQYSVKQHCVFDDSATPKIIGAHSDPSKNDDMFRIQTGASSYLEYIDRGAVGEPNRLKWIQRDSGAGEDLMMPAGPPGSFADWDAFIMNKPAVLTTVESACYPTTVSLCAGEKPEKMFPAPGHCGAAHKGYYADAAAILAVPYGQCVVGGPTKIVEKINSASGLKTYHWECEGDPKDIEPAAQCYATQVIDGVCGTANGRTYTSASEISHASLCAFGTPSKVPSGGGSWAWTCQATGEGGKSPNCMASAKASMETCNAMSSEGAMVLVQDLSGSYWDDLPNLKNNMSAVLNDADFKGWKVGLTSFTDFQSCTFCTPGDWPYRNELNLRDVSTSKAAILNEIASWTAWNGGDWEESQYYAISRTIADFKGQTDRPLNIVLATDAISHHHVAPATLASQLKAANANLIVLATDFSYAGLPSTSAFYANFIRSYGLKGVVVNLAADSSNFKTALKAGLTNSYCSDPANLLGCGPINGISCGDGSLGGSCKSGQTIVPQGHYTYYNGGGTRSVFQCQNQALKFVREDTL